jgi:acetolactate synthase-1/2/3 large subunit
VTDPADLDGVIKEMIAYDGPVVVDVAVDKAENCFPMVPSGAAHNEMILADDKPKDPSNATVSEEGMALV